MEGLGESEGKAAILAFRKMSAPCLGGAGMGVPPCGEALEELAGGAEAGAALQAELRALSTDPRAPGVPLESCGSGWGWPC